jgi:hypothetical protein
MSETETSVQMDDKALFDAAIAPEAPAQAEAPAQKPSRTGTQEAGQPRDEHGKFAARTEQTPPATPSQPTRPSSRTIPRRSLRGVCPKSPRPDVRPKRGLLRTNGARTTLNVRTGSFRHS